jgi:uncharacterized protein with PQ loop repeat
MSLKLILGIAFTVLFLMGPCFQLIKLISVKNSKSLSSESFLLNNVGQICVIYYSNLTNAGLWVYINSICSIILNCLILFFIWFYDERRKIL